MSEAHSTLKLHSLIFMAKRKNSSQTRSPDILSAIISVVQLHLQESANNHAFVFLTNKITIIFLSAMLSLSFTENPIFHMQLVGGQAASTHSVSYM